MPLENQSIPIGPDAGSAAYGCIFCRSGREKSIAEAIERDNPGIQVIAAKKLRRRRTGRAVTEEAVPVFPGYVFFCADENCEVRRFFAYQDVYRLLRDSNGDWRLRGADEAFARKLFGQQGVLGLSRAYFENDRIRIVDGILKDYEGCILRVNRRAQTAQIRIDICGRETLVWLGFELIDLNEGGEAALRLHNEENGNAQEPV